MWIIESPLIFNGNGWYCPPKIAISELKLFSCAKEFIKHSRHECGACSFFGRDRKRYFRFSSRSRRCRRRRRCYYCKDERTISYLICQSRHCLSAVLFTVCVHFFVPLLLHSIYLLILRLPHLDVCAL